MNKVAPTMVALAVLGTACAIGYGYMKPGVKQQLARDAKQTARDMGQVKNEMCDVRNDVTEMARNLRNQM